MQAVNEVYKYHCENTIRAEDKRLVKGGDIFEYTQGLRERIAHVDALMATYMPIYDQLVQNDIAYRNFGKATPTAKVEDYPSAEDFKKRFAFEHRVMPLPNEDHPLFDMDEEDKQAVRAQFDEMLVDAHNDIIERMLEPMQHMAKRFAEYTGAKGQRFHTANLQNIADAARQARKLAIDPSPELLEHIQEIETMATSWVFGVEVLKGDDLARKMAAERLEASTRKLSAYFA